MNDINYAAMSVEDLFHEIIDITQASQWQFSDSLCTPEVAQETLNNIYDIVCVIKEKLGIL